MTTLVDENTEATAAEDWFAILYPQTGALRLFPSISLARLHYNTTEITKYGYRSPIELQRRNDHHTLEKMWAKLFEHAGIGWPRTAMGPLPAETETTPPDCSTETLAKELWGLMHRVGDRIQRAGGSKIKSKEHYTINVPKLDVMCRDEAAMKAYPRQCRVIILALWDLDEPYVLESTLKRMMLELLASGKLKTKQDSWLIFMFYRKQLIDDGIITRGNTDIDGADKDDEETL